MNGIASYLKNHTSAVIYALFGVMTAALAAALLTWTLMGSVEREIRTFGATLVSETPLRTEYLVGQSFEGAGAYLNIGTAEEPENIPFEDCTVTADFTSAGTKAVLVSYMYDEYTNYEAVVYVDVLFVRSLQIETYPRHVEVTEEGASFSEDFEAYAELDRAPQTDVFGPAEETRGGYRVRVNEDMYTVSCKGSPSVAGYYDLSVYCGETSCSFSVFNLKDRSLIVGSSSDVVPFESDAANAGSLTLVVTERGDGYQTDCTGKTSGYYVYTAADGTESVLPFAYELSDTEELLQSPSVEERLVRGGDGDEYYEAVYGGRTFTASASLFRTAVVGGMIVEDHGYKLVIDSDKRILRFTYDPADPTDPADPAYDPASSAQTPASGGTAPTLTLYVTDYDMNPLLGTGNGWSRGVYIYTGADGKSYKIPFYMQAWVWTYVPLSSNYGDVYSEVVLNDFVYNHEAPVDLRYNSYYLGTMYANITYFDRGNGFVNERFSAPQELWLSAAMGM